jgi:hypothetical protein
VIAVTDALQTYCQAGRVVRSRSIPKKLFAAVILLSLSGGVASVARASASETQPVSTVRTNASQPVHHMREHSCCPGVHKILVLPIAVAFPPENVPCREHPCCVIHGSDAPPSLPASGIRGLGLQKSFGEKTGDAFQICFAHNTFRCDAFHAYFSSSMVLRI